MEMENGFSYKLKEDALTQLFEMFRYSHAQIQKTIDKQTDAILGLERLLREGVQLEEIKTLLQEEGKIITNLNNFSDSINNKNDNIIKILNDKIIVKLDMIHSKLWKVLTIITLLMSLISVTAIITTIVTKNIDKEKHFEKFVEQIINEKFKTIEERIEELHPNITKDNKK